MSLGWRLFVADRSTADLRAPWFGATVVEPHVWHSATCARSELARLNPSLAVAPWYLDRRPHTAPGDRCSCGWRVYPTWQDLTAGVCSMPRPVIRQLERLGDRLLVAGTEYGGKIAATARFNVPARALDDPLVRHGLTSKPEIEVCNEPGSGRFARLLDERHTVRAELICVTGPLHVAPGLPRRARQALSDSYGAPSLVDLPTSPCAALTATPV